MEATSELANQTEKKSKDSNSFGTTNRRDEKEAPLTNGCREEDDDDGGKGGGAAARCAHGATSKSGSRGEDANRAARAKASSSLQHGKLVS